MSFSKVDWIVRNLSSKSKINFTYKPLLNENEYQDLLPNPVIVDNAIVYHDFDLRTAQYWGSCGVAATITQLRHLNPKRINRFSVLREGKMGISDSLDAADFVDEISPKVMLGSSSDFFFDGAAGRPKIDQAWLFSETRNSVNKIEQILTKGTGSNLKLIKHPDINSEKMLEEIILKVLGNNHLAYLTVDGAFRRGENYPFPSSAEEWNQRSNSVRERPPKEVTHHPIIDELKAVIDEQCSHQDDNENEGICGKLNFLLDDLGKKLKSPTHAVTISGVYESAKWHEVQNSKHTSEQMRLYRVLDSNPGPNYTDSIRYPKIIPTGQGTVRYMTINELWAHISRMRSTRILEWTTDKRGICGANEIQPFVMFRGREIEIQIKKNPEDIITKLKAFAFNWN